MTTQYTEQDLADLDWLQLKRDIGESAPLESQKEKLIRKIRENPAIPIGVFATTTALCVGLYSFRRGNKKLSQYMMRTRIAAQGFTVLALVLGIGMGASKAAKMT